MAYGDDKPITRGDLRDLMIETRSMPGVRTPGSNSTLDSNFLVGTTNSVVDGFSKLAAGTATTGDVLNVTTNVVSKFGSVGQVAANALQQLGEGALNAVAAMRETSKVGVTMGGDLFRFNEEIKGAHLTIPEFTDLLARGSRSIAGAGAGMDKSASAFLKVAADVQASPIAVDLKAYGVTAKELAEVTEISMIGQRGLNAETVRGRQAMKDAAAAAVELSVEMTATAALTGKSRKQQQDELRAQLERAEVQASVMLMGPKFAEQFKFAQESMSKFGKSYQDLLTEMATPGGIRTKEGVQLAASLPPGQLDAMQAYADAIKSGDKERIEAQRKSTEATLANTGANREWTSTVAVTGNSVLKFGQVLTDSYPLQQAITSKMEEVREKEGIEITRAEALNRMTLEEIDKIKGGKTDAKTGVFTPDDRAAISRTVNSLDNLGKVAAAGLAKEFTNLSGSVANFTKDGIIELNRKFKEMASPAGLKAEITGGVSDAIKGTAQKLGVQQPEAKPKSGFDVGAPLPKSREFGSLGSVGKLIEDFGKETPALLHGREGVITESQLKAVVGESQKQGANDLASNFGSIFSNLQSFQPTFNELPMGKDFFNQFESQIKNINTKIDSKDTKKLEEQFTQFANQINPKEASANIKEAMAQVKMPDARAQDMMGDLFGNFKSFFSEISAKASQNKSAPEPAPVQPKPEQPPVRPISENITLKDVKEELVQLNMSVKQLVATSSEGNDLTSRQVRATRNLSGNRFV